MLLWTGTWCGRVYRLQIGKGKALQPSPQRKTCEIETRTDTHWETIEVISVRIKTTILLFLFAFFICSCASKEERIKKIQRQFPGWDQAVVEKVALREVEVGMTQGMVLAAIGKPYKTVPAGDEEKWTYAVIMERGQGSLYPEYVYFVYFTNGKVVRIEGNKNRLGLIPVR
jgi:outer membrane protein assembly factor BamE (lipoprotein component of BamABCDE complex)